MKVICSLDGDKMKPRPSYRPRQGGNGLGVNYADVAYTMTSTDRHMVAVCARTVCVNFQGSNGNSVATVERCPSIIRMHGNDVHVVVPKKHSDSPLTTPENDATIRASPRRGNRRGGESMVRMVLYH